MKKAAPDKLQPPRSARLIQWIVLLPRLTRIVLAAVFALALTLAITPIVDDFYLANLYDFSTRVAPSLVSTGIGLVFYFVGWRLIIGYAGETPSTRTAILWYFILGVLACVVVIVLVVLGAVSGTLG